MPIRGVGMGMGETVPTTGIGSKLDGVMLDRPWRVQVVIERIVGLGGREHGAPKAPKSRWDYRPIPIPIPSTLGIPIPLSPVITFENYRTVT